MAANFRTICFCRSIRSSSASAISAKKKQHVSLLPVPEPEVGEAGQFHHRKQGRLWPPFLRMAPAGQPEPRVSIFTMAPLLLESQATRARESSDTQTNAPGQRWGGRDPAGTRVPPCDLLDLHWVRTQKCTESTEYLRAGLRAPPPLVCSSLVGSELVRCPQGKTTARKSTGLFLVGPESPSWHTPVAERLTLQHAGARPLSHLHPKKGPQHSHKLDECRSAPHLSRPLAVRGSPGSRLV